MVGHRHRDRHVDADHADLDGIGEGAGGITVAGEYRGAIAVFMVVDHLDGVVEGAGANDRKNRSEDFFLVDGHVGGDAVKQRAADKIAVLIALQREAAAVDNQLGAFADALVDVTQHLFLVHLGDHGTHLGGIVGGRADLQRLDAGLEFFHQRIGGLFAHGDRDRDCHAALAGGAIARAHQRVGCLVHVGVGHDHHVVLGAAQGLHALAVGGAARIDIFGDRGGADKADRLDVGMVEQRVDGELVAVDDVEHAFGETGFLEQFPGQHRCGRIALGGLQDKGVSAGNGDGVHPHRHHGREVERGDAGDHAQWLAVGDGINARSDIAGEIALEQVGNAAGEFDHLDAAGDFAQCVVMGLAVFARDLAGDVGGVAIEQFLELEHEAGALQGRHGAPGRLRRLGIGDSRVDFLDGRQRKFGDLLAGCRVEDRGAALRAGYGEFAANGVFNDLHGQATPLSTLRSFSNSSSICSLEMIKGGDSAMMSPVVRISKPSS